MTDRLRNVWESPGRWCPTRPDDYTGHRPAVVAVYLISRFWIAAVGILVGILIATVVGLPLGWWISLLVVPELLHTVYELRCGRRDIMAGLLVHGTVIGLIGLLLRLPSYSGVSLIFIVVGAVILLPPRSFRIVIGYQLAWTAAAAWLDLAIGHPEWSPVQETALEAIAILFFSASVFVLLWAVMRELDLLDQLRNRLLGTVSHELRNPLTGVIGMGEVLREGWQDLDPAVVDEFLDLITGEGAEAAAIVEDLLTVVRTSAGALDLTLEDVLVVDQTRPTVASLTAARKVDVVLTGDENLTVRADPTRLRQILRNLLTNVLRYGGERIEIRLTVKDGSGSIVVADNGAGIPREEWETVFESFTRATGVRRHAESVGLGLPISRSLARKMGGDLTYRHTGGWSMFELTLPPAANRSDGGHTATPATSGVV